MSQSRLEAEPAPSVFVTPVSAPETPFAASPLQMAAALVSYAAGWLYVAAVDSDIPHPFLPYLIAFTLLFVLMTELLNRDRPHPRESWIWLGCAAMALAGLVIRFTTLRRGVWPERLLFLFLHGFAVWWALSRSGALMEGKSGPFLPLDLAFGLLATPFSRRFFLRLHTMGFAAGRIFKRRDGMRPSALGGSLAAMAAALGLFLLAAQLLTAADSAFARLLDGALSFLRNGSVGSFALRLALSLPVGAYLFALLDGSARQSAEAIGRRRERILAGLERARRVPSSVWTALISAFVLMYLLFFVLHAKYLFGAFFRTLPSGFIVSQYARQGFFELCAVMAVNLVLLGLATRTAIRPVRQARPLLALCLALLGESLLFALFALSKLILYIDCFGFTPLRLESCWLVCVLIAACGCAAAALSTEKRTFRGWATFSAVSLAILCLF